MLPNALVFGIGAALAASWFLVPLLLSPNKHHTNRVLVSALYIAVFSCLMMLYGMESAAAVTLLGIVFAVLGKVLAINFKMVRSTNYPKHRRCY
jgi:uncharacterized membrane protein